MWKTVCSYFHLQEFVFADHREKMQKLEPAKNFMPHGRFQNMITPGATNASFDRVLSFNKRKKYFLKMLTKNMHIYSRNNHIKLPRKYKVNTRSLLL